MLREDADELRAHCRTAAEVVARRLPGVGPGFAVAYYAIFRFAITKFNLPRPGRESDEELAELQKAEAK
jgi:phosphotransferase system  glucose/maltose/N-acetylglucosamine-specific IIC component